MLNWTFIAIIYGTTPNQTMVKVIQEHYSDKVRIMSLDGEMLILEYLFKGTPSLCFSDFADNLQILY